MIFILITFQHPLIFVVVFDWDVLKISDIQVDKANIHKIITPDVSDKMDVFDDSNQNDTSRYVTKKKTKKKRQYTQN